MLGVHIFATLTKQGLVDESKTEVETEDQAPIQQQHNQALDQTLKLQADQTQSVQPNHLAHRQKRLPIPSSGKQQLHVGI